MSTPAVSVIIPTFNRRGMVRHAIGSVIAQRERDFELIVVDDGSTDGSCELLQAFAPRCAAEGCGFRFERISNRGPAGARNHGLAIARGRYTAFLDSDDLWRQDKLSRQLNHMQSRGCAISQTQEIWIRHGRRVNPGLRQRKLGGDIFVQSLRTCLISPSAVMVETRLLRQAGGFDERMLACEDYDLWLRLLVENHADLLDDALVVRRAGHLDQLSATTPALDRFRILALTKLIAGGALSAERRLSALAVLAEKCAVYGGGLRRRNRVLEADLFEGIASQALRPTNKCWPDQALVEQVARAISLQHETKGSDAVP